MLKILIFIGTIALVGCASSPPEKPYTPADMTNFRANCLIAKVQIDSLQQKINEYLAYHQNRPPTLDDRRYYGKLKNNLWALRSTCSAKQL
jgi:hypothetical protein